MSKLMSFQIKIKNHYIKNLLLKIKSNHFIKDNIIIVIGGDGFMLQTLKKYKNYKNISMGLILVIMVFL